MQVNTQPFEKQNLEARLLEIEDIWLTIQGEGPYAGMPATFVRLSGCNLQCKGCDTDYTSKRNKLNPMQAVDLVRSIGRTNLVVLTGGEPFRQNITPLAKALLMTKHIVQIETNGTLYLPDFPFSKCTIVCSPKTPIINDNLRTKVNCWKYVIQAGCIDKDDGLPTSVLGMPMIRPARPTPETELPIYIQPMDEGDPERNQKNMQAAIQSVLNYNYILSLQVHKLAGLA